MLLAGILLGCKREEIRVYTVPKEKAPVARASNERGGAMPHIHYQAPEGWTETSAGGLLARFKVPGKGRDVDVSAIALPGAAKPLEVLNLMRREQVGLPPLTEEEQSSTAEKVTIGDAPGELYDMVSTEPVLGESKARVMIALLQQDDVVWYFKMGGEDDSVRNEKPKFLQFLKSVQFDYSDHSESVGQFTSTNVKEAPGPAAKPVWEVPPAWKEAPPTQMLLAKFLLPGEGARKAEVTVSVFPQDAGGVLDNVNRWRGQLGLAAVGAGELPNLTKPLEASESKGILVDMSGTDPKTGQKARLIAAILPQGDRTWFYKLMGDEQVAEREREAFVKFVQTAKHPNG